jgi:translation initiation factor IF-2
MVEKKLEKNEKEGNLQMRPPIVVILGHVDHGKTTLLDFIRKTHIAEQETGGITQHIGAYEIEHNDKKITFIDTPGHEAFSAMRSRGAKVADIAVLVVAADEGVKPQTKEAILHIKKSGIPSIIAINKMDKPGADPEKVKRELVKNDIVIESLGGRVPCVEISAKSGKGIEDLLELILLVAEMENLRGDIKKSGEGVVIESCLDSQRGPTATLLLRDGILKEGDVVGTASALGKVKILEDFQKKQIKEAGPSKPAVVVGFSGLPQVGEKFKVYQNFEQAQAYIEKKEKKRKEGGAAVLEPGKQILNIVVKADAAGSLEALEGILADLPQEKVCLRILKSGVGEISEDDIKLAKSAKGYVVGFRVKISSAAQRLAERDRIKIMNFEVIYELAQAVRQLMEKVLEPEQVRKVLGKVKILAVFQTEKNRQVIGGRVTEGEIKRRALAEIIREGERMGRGKIVNLQKNKKDTERVIKGEECGLLYQGEKIIEKGDVLEAYTEERIKGEL